MRMEYVPDSSRARGNAYRPCASVATVVVTVEPARFALTSTPSICASCGELTTPDSATVEDWASVRSMKVKTSAAPTRNTTAATICLELICITCGSFLLCLEARRRQAFDMNGVLVVLLAHVFHQLLIRHQLGIESQGERPRVGAGIVDGDLDVEVAQVLACKPFDHVHLVAVQMAVVVQPGQVVEADGIDDQRVAFPAPD